MPISSSCSSSSIGRSRYLVGHGSVTIIRSVGKREVGVRKQEAELNGQTQLGRLEYQTLPCDWCCRSSSTVSTHHLLSRLIGCSWLRCVVA
jgi:hypothetical protein